MKFKESYSTTILYLPILLLLSTFTLFIITWIIHQTSSSATYLAEAESAGSAYETCSFEFDARIYAESPSGQRSLLNFETEQDLNPYNWTFLKEPFFLEKETAEYSVFSSELSFKEFPDENDVYSQNSTANVTLTPDASQYNLIATEIQTCENTDCAPIPSGASIVMKCGSHVSINWIVRKKDALSTLGIEPVLPNDCDLNNDSVCNATDIAVVLDEYGEFGTELLGDVNKDGQVDVYDYVIVSQID